jgi:hypothetical protein
MLGVRIKGIWARYFKSNRLVLDEVKTHQFGPDKTEQVAGQTDFGPDVPANELISL